MKKEFEDILREKLRDHDVSPPEGEFDVIMRRVGAPARRSVPLGRYIVAAAAAVVIMLSVGIYFRNIGDTVIDDGLADQVMEDLNNASLRFSEPENIVVKVEEEDSVSAPESLIVVAAGNAERSVPDSEIVPALVVASFDDNDDPEPEGVDDEDVVSQGDAPQEGVRSVAVAPRGFDTDLYVHPVKPRGGKSKKDSWSMGLYADGNFGNDNNSSNRAMMGLGSSAMEREVVDPASLPYDDYDHKIPLSFGLTVRKNLAGNWGVETGLVYTYLHTKGSDSNTPGFLERSLKQDAHYIGIPLAITYTALRAGNFEVYARAAGTMDFNIRTKQDIELVTLALNGAYSTDVKNNHTASGVQWSVAANVGVMFSFTEILGIYFEPGVSHYFKNSHQPVTYWQDNSTNFNMKLGLRASF